jgi:hypothetical protein
MEGKGYPDGGTSRKQTVPGQRRWRPLRTVTRADATCKGGHALASGFMASVAFVVPFLRPNSLRFVAAAAALPGVRVALLSQDPEQNVPRDLRRQLVAFQRAEDALQADSLEKAVRSLGRQLGGLDRLLGILEPLQVPLAEVRERLGIRGMDQREARNFRDKAQMKDVLRDAGLPVAAHLLCASVEQGLEFAARVGYPVVGKPPAGAGAKTTVRAGNQQELAAFLAEVKPAPGREVLLEEFVQGREFSFDSVTVHGRHVWSSVSEYYPTPLQVLENPWIQWSVVLPREIEGQHFARIAETGPAVLSALGMYTGLSHMEWFCRDDGSIAIGEVGARPPGAHFMTLMSYAHDADMYRAWAQLMVHERFEPPARRFASGAVYVRGVGDGPIARVRGLDEVRSRLGDLLMELQVASPGEPAGEGYEGDGHVIVRHPQTEVVRGALKFVLETLKVERS